MSIVTVRAKLAAQVHGTTALTMQYASASQGKGQEIYTATIAGKQIVVVVPPMSPEDEIVSQIVAKFSADGPSE